MRVLHAASLLRPLPGIVKQMTMEQQAANADGINWQSRLYSPLGTAQESEVVNAINVGINRNSNFKNILLWLIFKLKFFIKIKRIEKNYDLILLRYSLHDPFQLLFIFFSNKPILLVHHTLEVPELIRSNTIVSKMRGFLEMIFGFLAIRASSGVVGVTGEIKRYEISRAMHPNIAQFTFSNGIDFDDKCIGDTRSDIPEFLFVSSYFYDWHGLDVLLRELSKSNVNIKIHIVGQLSEDDYSFALNDSRIILHGVRSSEEIEEIAESCWIGLASFALERKGMYEACTLKVREYLQMGLPVLGGYTEVFADEFSYYKKIPLDINILVDHAKAWQGLSRESVKQESQRIIDKRVVLGKFYTQLKNAFGDS